MGHCKERVGDAYFRTQRASITTFVNLLAGLEQNPGADWRSPPGAVTIARDADPNDDVGLTDGEGAAEQGADDDLATFKL